MRIGKLALAADITIDTIRYYERRGILPTPTRTASGYRIYTCVDVDRLRLARRLQQLGLTLTEVAEALHAHDEGDATCDSERWRLTLALDRVEQRINELRATRREISAALAACEAGTCAL